MIRSAVVNDAPAIGALKVRAWRAAYAGFMSAACLDGLDPVEEAVDGTTRLDEAEDGTAVAEARLVKHP
ncbi:hypothetical protein ACFWP2_38640 [Kitasatospora sp. NPDC058444]|uniref:hypothetical protein n=1 Tax=Kitasatospora sp. NPDC058444 TaxID=3346504 RepID=UPI0036657767